MGASPVLLLAAAALVVPPAAAAASPGTPHRTCAQRIERGAAAPKDVRVGPVSFAGLGAFADSEEFDAMTFEPASGGFGVKSPVRVRAGRVVSISIAAADRDAVDLAYGWTDDAYHVPSDSVRLSACRAGQPLFSRPGRVGPWTTFSGGFELRERGCVRIEVRARGSRRVHRRLVSFGMGDSCRR